MFEGKSRASVWTLVVALAARGGDRHVTPPRISPICCRAMTPGWNSKTRIFSYTAAAKAKEYASGRQRAQIILGGRTRGSAASRLLIVPEKRQPQDVDQSPTGPDIPTGGIRCHFPYVPAALMNLSPSETGQPVVATPKRRAASRNVSVIASFDTTLPSWEGNRGRA